MDKYIWLIPLLPLAGFIINGVGRNTLPKSILSEQLPVTTEHRELPDQATVLLKAYGFLNTKMLLLLSQ